MLCETQVTNWKISITWNLFSMWSVISSVALPLSFGEMYSSMVNVHQAVSVERFLLNHLRTYIEDEMLRLDDIKRFYRRVSDRHSKVAGGPVTTMANPLVAFTLIKRLQSDWLNVVYSNEAQDNAQALRSSYEKVESTLPKLEDLQGAAKGLMRLQDVYGLRVEGLTNGLFQRISDGITVDVYRPAVSVALSGDDCFLVGKVGVIYRPAVSVALSGVGCFLVGKVAYEQEDYYHSVQWLEEATRLFRSEGRGWSPERQGSLEVALDHLAFSHFMTGNVSYALSLSQELLQHDPWNRRVLRNVKKYEKLLEMKQPPEGRPAVGLRRPATTYLRTRNAYEWLCQTRGSQPKHHENPGLFCDLFTNGRAALLLQPVQREVLSLQPYVVLYHGFVTGAEAQRIRDLARPGLRRSVVASGEKQITAEYRISQSAWLKETAHPIVRRLDQRIAELTGLNVQMPYAEHLQVVNYGIGGHYEPHFDHATSAASPLYRLNTGNRVATFMIYLSPVEAGGSTAFIYANFSVPVVENAALFWWNLHRNGQGNGDTLHAGCPVLVGDKWVANKWVHEHGQEFHRRCSSDPSE